MSTLSERVLGCAVQVREALGCGFLEKVYENALVHELRKCGLHVEQQKAIPVRYDGIVVGDYVADLIVEGRILIELKAVSSFAAAHTAVCLNYLRATNLPLCLLLNFGRTRIEIKRLVGDRYVDCPEPL